MAFLLHIPSAKYLNILLFSFSPFRLPYSLSTFSSLCIPLNWSVICFTIQQNWWCVGEVSQKNQADKTKLWFHSSGRMYQFCIPWICAFLVVGWFRGLGGQGYEEERVKINHTPYPGSLPDNLVLY